MLTLCMSVIFHPAHLFSAIFFLLYALYDYITVERPKCSFDAVFISEVAPYVTLESTKYYYSIVPNLSSIMMNQTNETFDWIVPEVNADEEIY